MSPVAASTSVLTATELASLQSDLDAYLGLYAPLFQCSEQGPAPAATCRVCSAMNRASRWSGWC